MEEEKNYIRFRAIIEVLGKPKEHVESSLKGYVEKIKSDKDFMILKDYFAAAKQQEDMFSAFAEIELVAKSVYSLVGFCFDYMPSSIDIIKPETMAFESREFSNIINDLQAKLHNVDMVAKKMKNEADFLKKNLKVSLKNAVFMALGMKKSADKEELAKLSGIDPSEIENFLEDLIKEGKIKKENMLYLLA